MELYITRDIPLPYLSGCLSLVWVLYSIVTIIYIKRIWKYETCIFLMCALFLSFDYIFSVILLCTNFKDLYETIFIPEKASTVSVCVGVVLFCWIFNGYYNWNVMNQFKESFSIKTRVLCQKVMAICMYFILIIHIYWYWELIENFSVK